ncbi:hypothetical protein AAFF_G00183130 [Aldrovandia affinis]|uniref:Uncharacterized protein n=1 Tax=Aldrovandia affinis TaxID=143900 RepID=A0AAD7RKB0_9TELE|nr:hypothetical protein AAFF_G00183130 [Aldrovandia affinis]
MGATGGPGEGKARTLPRQRGRWGVSNQAMSPAQLPASSSLPPKSTVRGRPLSALLLLRSAAAPSPAAGRLFNLQTHPAHMPPRLPGRGRLSPEPNANTARLGSRAPSKVMTPKEVAPVAPADCAEMTDALIVT